MIGNYSAPNKQVFLQDLKFQNNLTFFLEFGSNELTLQMQIEHTETLVFWGLLA
jgi:hypothetical protein